MKQQLNITIGICTLICMLISACKREKFSSFENGEIHYQIFKNKDCVLRAVNTDGEGVRKLELFSNEGRLVDEITIENEPFEISKFENDTIFIKFHVSHVELFLPWFNKKNNKPTEFNKFALVFDYEKVMETPNSKSFLTDSFHLSSENQIILFANDSIISSIPLEKVNVFTQRLTYRYSVDNKPSIIEFKVKDKELIVRFLDSVISSSSKR